MKVHPDRQHIIYPLGCAVVIEDISGNDKPSLLWGHTDYVTCIAISNQNGELLASGQKTHMGYKVCLLLVWKWGLHVNKNQYSFVMIKNEIKKKLKVNGWQFFNGENI